MTAPLRAPDLLGPDTLDRLPRRSAAPATTAPRSRLGMAHIGVGAFHRCHQAEFTDDMLEARASTAGASSASTSAPPSSPRPSAAQDGLYTRVLRSGDRAEARVIGCLLTRRRQPRPPPTPRSPSSPTPPSRSSPSPSPRRATATAPPTARSTPTTPTSATTSPTRRRRAACPASSPRALDLRRATARPPDHAHQLRQHPRQRRHPRRRRRARWPSASARPRRLDRRQRRLPLDHGRPHRPRHHARRPRRARAHATATATPPPSAASPSASG